MTRDNSFDDLMDRLRLGDPEAARHVFHTFAQRLIGLARSRLDTLILRKEGAEDVVQEALLSFFRRHARHEFNLANWDSLWALLTVITLRKCGHKIEHYRALCRNVFTEAAPPESSQESAHSWMMLAREPSPAEAAMLEDTLRQLLHGLDEREQRIVRLLLEGHSVPEISQKVGRSEYMVRKTCKQVRERWDRLCD
jgi:RNA polymerase sigma-70 factor (ECF subfamily)